MNATLCLIRQDPARAALVRALASCLGIGLLIRIVPDITTAVATLSADDLPGGFVPMYVLLTAMVAVFVLGANAWTRSSRLALGLPVSTRRVWVVRTGSLMAVGLLSVAALTAAMGLSLNLDSGGLTLNGAVALAAVRGAATVLVLLFAYQLPHSGRDRIPMGPAYVVYLIGATTLTVIVSSVQVTSVAGTLVLLAIAIAIGVYLWLRIPTTFSIGPTIEESEIPVVPIPQGGDSAPAEAIGDEAFVTQRRHPGLELQWVVFRGLKTNVLTWFAIAIVGASAAVAILEFHKGTNAFLAFAMVIIYQLQLLQVSIENLTPFDPLPVSRRVLWAHSAGTGIAATAIGACCALAIVTLNPRGFTQLADSGCCVKAPWDYMELTRDGRAPTITTPWGESYTPTVHPLWKGGKLAVYDPFEVGGRSSPRFAEYQIRRAVAAVYSIPVPVVTTTPGPEPPNQNAAAQRNALILGETYGRPSADRNHTGATGVLLFSIIGTTLMLAALLRYGSSVHRRFFKRASIGAIIFIIMLFVALFFARLLGFTDVWYVGALISIGVRSVSHWLPIPTWVLWFLCVTFWAGAYLILERVFSSIEFPREKTMNRFAEEY